MDREIGFEPIHELSLLRIQSAAGYQLPYSRTKQISWLRSRDLNPNRQIQNLLAYQVSRDRNKTFCALLRGLESNQRWDFSARLTVACLLPTRRPRSGTQKKQKPPKTFRHPGVENSSCVESLLTRCLRMRTLACRLISWRGRSECGLKLHLERY